MTTRRVTLVGSVPIPVGHRVRVTWYEAESPGGFFRSSQPTMETLEAPVVVDLHTKIRYGALIHFRADGGVQAGATSSSRTQPPKPRAR